jgi:hypothetical protein
MIDRVAAETAVAQLLIDSVGRAKYPSQAQMDLIEAQLATPEAAAEYLEMLMEKVRAERYPSVTMLRRMQRIAASMPEPEPEPEQD